MGNLRICSKKVTVFLLLVILAGSFLGIGKSPVVNAATKTVTVKNVKKGTKVTSGNYVYKVTLVSKKKSTVSVVGLTANANKKLTKVVIPKSVKIKSKSGKNKGTYSYKVTAVAKNAFKSNKKITTVTIGDNVTSIGKNAFSGCTKLKKVTIGKAVKTIGESAFAGNKKLTEVVIPKNSKLETIEKRAFKGCINLKKINLENAKNLKNIDNSAFEDTAVNKDKVEEIKETIEAEKYSYEVIPLMAPFNSYFYIKTDNPDPDSFRFVDEKTKYADEGKTGSITPTDTVFSDVIYENSGTRRVKGGYIAAGSSTDGGELRLQLRKVTGTHSVYNITTGETTIQKDYDCKDTTVTVQVAELKDVVDYLISTYGDSSKSYFDNLSGIESGFSSECLYKGVAVLGEQKKSTTAPYYGLSTSPHVDQIFYIQSPYYRTDSKSMLISALYPMKYDSIGFPSIMMSVAKKLDSTVTVKWSSSAHYLVDVTYNGETKSYGGQGSGGGQGINANQIKYWYSFDGSSADAYMKRNLKDVSAMIQEYGAMEVPEEPTDQPKLTWASVRQTVGKEGSYVKLTLLTSIFGGSTDGYTFMYDDGSTSEGSQGWGSVGHFSNAWYDGRYFNKWEYYYPGAKFADTVKTESPSIIMKDVSIKLPDDGNTYYYNYNTMDKVSQYDTETGVWSGFMTYRYDSESQTWKASILNSIKYREGYTYKSIDNQNFIDACTITMEEALTMNLDANTDKEPESYYIYNGVTSPGTYHRAGN
ncbi:MAG: leucine-rich repeat domain-containing protein [Lachnospiraceae bacterium]|nr:leucine-rich repeat domain-containing protein [Lachnospiraceae bacterium]